MKRRNDGEVRERISGKLQAETKLVKSAGRVLEILEYFDDVQRSATVMEVAVALNYPQSSTSALLRSLVATGYLNYNPHKRTYITSSRVALLGSWRNAPFFAEGALISLMKELNVLTGDAIVLAIRNGLYVQYIHVIQATSPARVHLTLGTVRPLAASGAGYAILSTMSDAEVTRIVMRINSEALDDQPLIKVRDLLAELAEVRERGYSFTCDMVTPGGGIMAVPLPQMAGQPLMVVGICGVSQIMRHREDELAATLSEQVARRFGLQARNLTVRQENPSDPLPLAIMRARMRATA